MMAVTRVSIVYKADPVRGAEWARLFALKAPHIDFYLWPETGPVEQVRYLAAWEPPAQLQQCFPNLALIFSTGAGVDHIDFSSIPAHIPLVRMIEPGIIDGMMEYLTLAVLSIHRRWALYAQQQGREQWQTLPTLPAAKRRIGVLGTGVLGQAALQKLASLGFSCAAWGRTARTIDHVECHVGQAALPAFLARTDILICLLPLTDETRGFLNQKLFALLPSGASLINVGRGAHLVQEDLRAALDSGQLAQAVLDVCDPEPLPSGHWMWSHPRIMLTPHIASITQPGSAVDVVLANIDRHEQGLPVHGIVDRQRGY